MVSIVRQSTVFISILPATTTVRYQLSTCKLISLVAWFRAQFLELCHHYCMFRQNLCSIVVIHVNSRNSENGTIFQWKFNARHFAMLASERDWPKYLLCHLHHVNHMHRVILKVLKTQNVDWLSVTLEIKASKGSR